MAKQPEKPKKSEEKSTSKTKTTSKEKTTPTDKNNGNNTTVAEKTTPVDNKVVNNPPVVEKPVEKIPEPAVERPFDIYDYEPVKQVLEFPQTQTQTETDRTCNVIYKIDVTRLPQDIVDKINDYLTDFRAFISAPDNLKDISKIPVIMEKDKIASDAIKVWLAPKREYFEQEKLKQAGGIAVTNVSQGQPQAPQPQVQPTPQMPDGKIVIDKNNSQNIINSAPSVPSAMNNPNQPAHTVVTPHPYGAQAGQNPTPNYNTHNQHQFIPRTPSADYVPTIGNNNIGGINLPPAFGDNSKTVNDMMAQMAQQHDGGHNHTTMGAPISNANFIDEYAKTIHQTITVGFPMYYHWGYIPLDSLKDILKNTEKSLSYEIVLNGEQSYVKISNGARVVETEKFSCR